VNITIRWTDTDDIVKGEPLRPIFQVDMSRRHWLLASTVLLLFGGVGQAATLVGLVTDAGSGDAMPFVRVVAVGTGDDGEPIEVAGETGLDGRYRLEELPAGRLEVVFDFPGYAPETRVVMLTADETRTLDLAKILVAVELDEQVVIATPLDDDALLQPGYLSIDAGTLDELPGIAEADPLRALQSLPGVAAASDVSSGLYIRGGGPDQTLVAMDGVPVYNPTHAFGLFSTFNNDVVDDLTLYKGAYPATYGGRLGAVLDVGLRRPESSETRGKIGVSLIAARVLAEGSLGEDRWLVAGRRTYLEPVLSAIRTEENPIPSYYFYDLNATYLTERLGGLTTVSIYHGRDEVSVDADENTTIDLGWGNTVAMLRHERPLHPRLTGSVTLSTSLYGSDADAEILATPFEVRNDLQDVTAAAGIDWDAGRGHRIRAGLVASSYDLSYLQSFNYDVGVDYGTRPSELSAYVDDRWLASPSTTVRAGLRARYISDGDRSLLEPRITVAQDIAEGWRLKAGFGLFHQYLQLVTTEGFSAGDFYLPIDETAELGRSLQGVLGLEWTPTPQDVISLEFYETGLDELVVFDNTAPVDQTGFTAEDIFVTGGSGHARGMELLIRRDFGDLTGWIGYTLGTTRRQFAELNEGEEFSPKYDRTHDVNVVLARRWGDWKLGAAFRYGTGQAFTPAAARYEVRDPGTGEIKDLGQVLAGERGSARLLPYHRLDLSARRPITLLGLPGELVIEVFNVYNRRNEWFVQYETDGPVTEATVVQMLPLIPSVGVNLEF
jgi:hypothetical protein